MGNLINFIEYKKDNDAISIDKYKEDKIQFTCFYQNRPIFNNRYSAVLQFLFDS